MNHLSTINNDFIKKATKWDELSRDEQQLYLKKHKKSKHKLTAPATFDKWLSSQETKRISPYMDPFSKTQLKEKKFINLQTGKPSLFTDLPLTQQSAIKEKIEQQLAQQQNIPESQPDLPKTPKIKRKKFTISTDNNSSTIRALNAKEALTKFLAKSHNSLTLPAQEELDKQPDSDTLTFGNYSVTPFIKQKSPKISIRKLKRIGRSLRKHLKSSNIFNQKSITDMATYYISQHPEITQFLNNINVPNNQHNSFFANFIGDNYQEPNTNNSDDSNLS
jgi:sugar-specific transcriptional regulator TrmB